MGYFDVEPIKFKIGSFVYGVNNPDLKYGAGIVLNVSPWDHDSVNIKSNWVYLVTFHNDMTDKLDTTWFFEGVLKEYPDPTTPPEDEDTGSTSQRF